MTRKELLIAISVTTAITFSMGCQCIIDTTNDTDETTTLTDNQHGAMNN